MPDDLIPMPHFVSCVGCGRMFNENDVVDNRALNEHDCDMSELELDAFIAELNTEEYNRG